MDFVKIFDTSSYKSWVQLERDAQRIFDAMDELSSQLTIIDGESIADNVLYFDTEDNE